MKALLSFALVAVISTTVIFTVADSLRDNVGAWTNHSANAIDNSI